MKSLNFKPYTFYLLLCLLLTMSMKCKKDETGIEALPPATQEGKRTFGCLVNGKVFLSKGNLSNPPIQCSYQLSNNKYNFLLSIANSSDPNIFKSVSLRYMGNGMNTGKFILEKYLDNQFNADYSEIPSNLVFNEFFTNENFKGEIIITKFDQVNQIISGTFWFDAVNNKGEKVEVRDGRFDMTYTK